jgi:hypothetical protein
MRWIGSEGGRVLFLTPMEEIRSLNGSYLPEAVARVTQRYRFQYPPDLTRPETVIGNPTPTLSFKMGWFETEGFSASVNEIQMNKDGVTIIAPTTDIAELIWEDWSAWNKENFGWRDPKRPPKRIYYSVVVVEFDVDPEPVLAEYKQILSILTSPLKELYGLDSDVKILRLTFSADPLKVANAQLLSEYNIERRIIQPYEHRTFHCAAPLPTRRHLEVLAQLENLVRSRAEG